MQTCRQLLSEPVRYRRLLSGKRVRPCGGSSLVETLAGFAIIIPIGLLAVDLTMVVTASQLNERLVEDAARAAGNQTNEKDAQAAAETAISSYQLNSPIRSVEVSNVAFDPMSKQVQVITSMVINLPVPLASLDKVTLNADAVEPIVAIPAPP